MSTPTTTPRMRFSVYPFIWLAFSGGGVLAAILLPVLAFLFALAFPLGWIEPPDHDQIAAVVGHPLTFLVLLAVFPVILIHAAHRFRYTLYDGLQVKHKGLVALLCYGGALAGSFATLVFLGNALTS
jgi:fumarate reductase subunit D